MKNKFTVLILLLVTLSTVLMGCRNDSNIEVDDSAKVEEEVNQEYNKFESLTLPKFETQTISGEKITSDIFKNHDITMINVFATWCSPCVAEMPALGELYKELPENVNLVGICIDTRDDKNEVKLARKIMRNSRAEFDVIIPNEELEKKFLSLVDALPTTIFVDSQGNIVGEVIVGAGSDKDKLIKHYKEEIDKRLELLNK
ncbi:TlpA family protein disulfide reductase [Tepidibacter sp. Z1-5]|uniref:TlpA family protein disulfide reductase n=1 Tax=Tepidibacter sp. Z1-5 TaxID=3134138 RepID=UPI0030C2FD3A